MYSIILVLFIVSGVVVTLWGWHNIDKGRKTRHWPSVQGTIKESSPPLESDYFTPHIVYAYQVAGQEFQRRYRFPGGTLPSEELVATTLNTYPQGKNVAVFYDPENPGHGLLQAGPCKDDWFVFAIGVFTLVFGLGLLLFGR